MYRSPRSNNSSSARVCGCGLRKRHRGCRARKVTTAAGEVRLSRVYFDCPKCLGGGCPLDERLGVEGRYRREAQRLICLAGASWSYEMPSAHRRRPPPGGVSEMLCQAPGWDNSQTSMFTEIDAWTRC